jgi:hypothetical protein
LGFMLSNRFNFAAHLVVLLSYMIFKHCFQAKHSKKRIGCTFCSSYPYLHRSWRFLQYKPACSEAKKETRGMRRRMQRRGIELICYFSVLHFRALISIDALLKI